jgi:hypothetical protein
VFWRFCVARAYIQAYGGNSRRGRVVQRGINYFDHFEHWSGDEHALYTFGCAGAAAWLLAALLAALEWRRVAALDAPLAEPLLPATAAFVKATHASPQQTAWTAEPELSDC